MTNDDEQKLIKQARERVDKWLESLPTVERGIRGEHVQDRLLGQQHVLAKIGSTEDREALFWFLTSFADYLMTLNARVMPDGKLVVYRDPPARDTILG